MKITIEESNYLYTVDWGKNKKVEDGFICDYFPSVEEAIESVLRLLENLYSKEKIADCLASGELAALDYSERGVRARDVLKGM